MAKAVYVKDDDVALWERAEQLAKKRRQTMSGLILNALERLLEEEDQ